MPELIFKEQSYKIGLCMEVHRELGHSFKEAVYKDALEYELKQADIPYERERVLHRLQKHRSSRKYKADFIALECIIIDAKATSMIVN